MKYTVKVLLEDSNKIKELQSLIEELKEENRILKNQAANAESKLVLEMQRSLRLQDELREANGTIRNLRECGHY